MVRDTEPAGETPPQPAIDRQLGDDAEKDRFPLWPTLPPLLAVALLIALPLRADGFAYDPLIFVPGLLRIWATAMVACALLRLGLARWRSGAWPRFTVRAVAPEAIGLAAAFCVLVVLTATHCWGKVLIPYFNPTLWDAQLYRLERAVHLGLDPGQFLLAILEPLPRVDAALDLLYGQYGNLLVFSTAWFLTHPVAAERNRYLRGFVLLWLGGLAGHWLVPALGPVYVFPDLAPILAARYPINFTLAADVMENYQAVGAILQGAHVKVHLEAGIAAMPSLHVGLPVFALAFCWERRHPLRFLFLAVVAAYVPAAVATGWHYIVDVYAGAALALACWAAVRLGKGQRPKPPRTASRTLSLASTGRDRPMIDHLPDDRFRRPERAHLRRLGMSTDPGVGSPQLTARERVLLYRLGAAIPEWGRAAIVGALPVDALAMVAAGAHRRRGQVALERVAPTSLPEPLRGSVTEAVACGRGTAPVHLLVLGDGSSAAAEQLVRAAPGALVAVVDFRRPEVLQGLIRGVLVPRQCEGGRTVDRVYWSRIDPSRQPWRPGDPLASVIVPTHDREDLLMEALDSIVGRQALADGFEVVVVENAPRPRLEPRIAETARTASVTVRHVHEPRPGLHRARHRGALDARGSILVYVDDDVVAPPGWLEALVAPFGDSSVAITGGPVRPLWESPPPAWVADIPDSYFSLLDLGDRELDLRYPSGAYGCNMAIRRDVLFEVGGFNPDAMGWERRLFWLRGDGETGLHLKVAEAGYRVLYHPSAGLAHRMPASRATSRAVRHRGLLVGLSHSFTSIRQTPRDRWLRLRLLARAGRSLGAGLRSAASAMTAAQRQLQLVHAFRAFGSARQHLAAAVQPSVLRYLTRPSFFTEDEP